ncbi:hypothetical protein GIB67_017188 [Kingdonia uniflora]|uniref:Nonsense-mediated mRNA decay factor SMG8 n=1 Tax=Kingdonia uniflora TaxID=39325 RepID=A0A7J7NKR3_9MAGN|nr:hypothetical protein GIB67_017188 [Kingdonia uniflora]
MAGCWSLVFPRGYELRDGNSPCIFVRTVVEIHPGKLFPSFRSHGRRTPNYNVSPNRSLTANISSKPPLMESPNPSPSLRVLVRPSSTTTTSTPTTTPSFTTSTIITPPLSSSTPSSSSLSEGVVVVGFIGSREDDVTQLINRVVEDNVFGSGNLDKPFLISDEMRERFKSRRISYYADEEKGMVFLQFVCGSWTKLVEESSSSRLGLDSMFDEEEFGDLQGMLVMFSVCHIIIFLQDGSRFDTQILKKFRVLQAAKHALIPFVKSHIKPKLTSSASSSSSFSKPTVPVLSNISFHGRGGGVATRHGSAISLMSSLGSYSSLFPGHCTPVILFVFVDDFFDSPNIGSHLDAFIEASSSNQSSNSNMVSRSSLSAKGSNSLVVLARPVSKSEGGFKKKVQSSLEAQIRFLIKKCRTLAGSEPGHTGSRGGGNPISPLLFSLEASRAVTLLDRKANQKGASLDFATSLVEEVLNGKATSDILLLDSHGHDATADDIQSIKDFIYRQSDALRGRGGLMNTTNNGSAAGAGMVAVAAAAAAASTASGKPFTTVDLPSLENWLTSCQLILDALLSGRRVYFDNSETCNIRAFRGNDLGKIDPVETALSWLEGGKSLNMIFSTTWCERTLPSAREIYMRELPAWYPTSLHEAHLDKALRAFQSMVKGPAVEIFRKKLEDECTSIWTSGRQLCDAVSLTGKPCMHQRHNVEADGPLLVSAVKPHSSGFVFLHACACGRSRRLRDDPFDFETANVTFNCFQNCDNLLSAFELPNISDEGPVHSSSWSLIRVGGPRYYQPSKGLLQSGFCSTEKFLLKWSISIEKETKTIVFPVGEALKGSIVLSNKHEIVESITHVDTRKTGSASLLPRETQTENVEKQTKHIAAVSSDDKSISFGKGVPHFAMRRPFAEVVAGSVATDVSFPPLQQRKNPAYGLERGVKQKVLRDSNEEQVHINGHFVGSQKSEGVSSGENSHRTEASRYTEDGRVLQIGGNIVPMNANSARISKSNSSLKHVTVYVGVEHECAYGHRFLLSSHHLNELGPLYSSPEKSDLPSSTLDRKGADKINLNRSSAQEKVPPHGNGRVTFASKVAFPSNSKQTAANINQQWKGHELFSELGNEENHFSTWPSLICNSAEDLEKSLENATVEDSQSAFSLLNRNLPIYMNCPHCKISKRKKGEPKINYANTVSQLQRIFLVTPPFPTVLATFPVLQFEAACLPLSILDRERQSQFSIGSQVILPPDSFITLRLPFVYGVQLEDKSLHPLNYLEHHPELTAWVNKGTILQVMTKGSNPNQGKVETSFHEMDTYIHAMVNRLYTLSQLSMGSQVILPPDRFISQTSICLWYAIGDGSLRRLNHLEHHPEVTDWVMKGTILEVMTNGSSSNQGKVETRTKTEIQNQ